MTLSPRMNSPTSTLRVCLSSLGSLISGHVLAMARHGAARASSASWPMAENGLPLDDFRILTPLIDAVNHRGLRGHRGAGMGHTLTMPWMLHPGPDATLAAEVDGMGTSRRRSGLH